MKQSQLSKEYLQAKRALFDRLYDNLNERQREAVFTVEGPLLVLAGAGSGKTTVLVNRIAHIIRFGNSYYSEKIPEDLTAEEVAQLKDALNLPKEQIPEVLSDYSENACPPWNMLCFTFTNKAANEMKERLSAVLGEDVASEIWAGTFHKICMRILRRFASDLGFTDVFTIYDTEDSKKTILACMREIGIDDKRLPVKTVISEISSMKNMLKSAKDCRDEIGKDFRRKQISDIYTLYQGKLKSANALDFDDIIMMTVNLLRENGNAMNYCRKVFKYVSVDEFQDTNYAQMELIRLLSDNHRNLMVVGDDDQSIYRFRGATIENILDFDKNYKNAKVIKLEQNYRSNSNILDAANAVIANNTSRHEKRLFSAIPSGDRITVHACENQIDEARFISHKIKEMIIREKRKYSDFAVLYRTNSQSNAIEQTLSRAGIPHKIVGNIRFYERKEVKDILAYLTIINNPHDDLRVRRIINEPKRKIGDKLIADVERLAAMNGKPLYEIVREAASYPLICKSAPRLNDFYVIIEKLRKVAKTETLSNLFRLTIDLSGYRDMLEAEGEIARDRLENIEELVSNAVVYEETHENPTLAGFLEEVALVNDIDSYDDENNAVILMTIHAAKGLEFPVVFIPGMEEGIFPGNLSQENDDIEEERRLAYVAITRAKDKVFCLRSIERLIYGRTQNNPPSRFIAEIPEQLCEDEDGSDIGGNRPVIAKQKKQTISKEFSTVSALKISNSKTGKSSEKYTVGDRVTHMVFGGGTVLSATEMGGDIIYEVAFDRVGTKKLMASFAKLKREEN